MEIARMLNDMGVEYIELTSAAASKQVTNALLARTKIFFFARFGQPKSPQKIRYHDSHNLHL
jgi:isopropylmalate/homocitrate/citramalate synthase